MRRRRGASARSRAQRESIVTADIGCHTHLNGAGRPPVRHWIERVDSRPVN